MTYESILKEIGGWGRYQKWLCFLLTLAAVPNGYFTMITIFTSKTPQHRCRILELDGPAENSTTAANYSVVGLEKYIPWDTEHSRYDRCHRYAHTSNLSMTEGNQPDDVSTAPSNRFDTKLVSRTVEKCDSGFVYDLQPGERTAVTEWDLVCDKEGIKPQITSLFMFGVLVGSFLSGMAADWFGRWCVIIFGTYFQFIFMILNIFRPGPWMYAALMFLAGGCALINFVAAVVLGAELSDIEHRAFIETAAMVGFAVGYAILPLFAYFIVDWKMLFLATGLTGILFIPYWWLIPESPRWLIFKGKFAKAKVILSNIAKQNRKNVNMYQLLSNENLKLIAMEDKETGPERKRFTHDRIPYVSLFTKPGMLTRTMCMCYTWWIISTTYYTMNLNTGNLGSNDLLNCFISGAVEIAGYVSVFFVLRNMGRRWLLITYMILVAILCAITPVLDKWSEAAALVSAMCGKFFVTSAFSLAYLFTIELFPTAARNQALGIASVCARVGGIIAPYIVFIGEKMSNDIPYIIAASLACTAGLLDFFLPETRGLTLPDTFEEANKMTRGPCCPIWRKKRPSSKESIDDAKEDKCC